MDYLATVYSEKNKPKTDYPPKLARHIINSLQLAANSKFLEIGCGRGEFLAGFKKEGLIVSGTDMCESARDFAADIDIRICAIGRDKLPFGDDSFDIVFSKSVIEHIPDPDAYMPEALRVLRPNGILITMTPDWEANYRTFFDDFTHVRPYSIKSLALLYEKYLLADISVEKFRQLPIVWKHPSIAHVCDFIAPFIPVRTKNKFLRWSRELMLLAIGRRPAAKET